MRTLTDLFEDEKNKKIGASPVWILKIPFVAGTLYLSDRTVTITDWDDPPIVTTPWIAKWGQIDEDIIGVFDMPMVSDFSVDIIIDPAAATDIHNLLWSESVETIEATLYLWFTGLDCDTDPPLAIWTGNIIDFERINELIYNVRLVDEGTRIDKNVGTVLSLADYANASLDDVGYTLNILYGAVEKVPARRMDVGKKTSLMADIEDDTTDFYITEGTGIAATDHIIIDSEAIHITTISSNHITACTRAVDSTTAANHSKGALVLEKQATCVFSFADHPVKSIGNIYALRSDGIPVDVTSICTKYTGQGGANDLAGYAGKAVITCPGYITFSLAVSLGLVDTIGVTSTPTPSTASGFTLCTGGPVEVRDNDTTSNALSFGGAGSSTKSNKAWEISWNYWVQTLPTGSDEEITIDFPINSHTHIGKMTSTGFVAYVGSPLIVADSASFNQTYYAYLRADGGGTGGVWGVTVSNAKAIYTETASVSSSKTGGVTGSVSGGDVMVGDNILISGEGYQDDGSGTFTGSASALIERPDHVFKHFLYTQAAWAVADFSTDAATPFAADSYKFSVVINTRKKLREWLAYMALQCRCWFRFAGGKASLLYRTDSISSDKTITAAMTLMNDDNTTSVRITRSPLDEIINLIHVYYQRDWTKSLGREAYQAVTKTSDATSISAYGEKERADGFLFDFVRDATMAVDIRDFYLARYKDRKKVVSGTVFLDNCEIEFADVVTFAALSNLVCEVRKAGLSPGSKDQIDQIMLTAREY